MIKGKTLLFYLIFIMFVVLVLATNIGIINNSVWESNLSKVRYSSTSFGDIDNDGDLDLALSGCLSDGSNRCEKGTVTKIYTNNGTSLVENLTWQSNLTGVGWSSTSFGDIDNDGDLDLALSGCTNASDGGTTCNGNIINKIYINNGTTLTEGSQWQSNLIGTFGGNIAFADINNNGKLDLLQLGRTTTGSKIAKIYINNETNLIEDSTWQNNLTGMDDASLSFADIDNNGYLDLALTGEDSNSAKKTKIYINNGTSLVENLKWQNNLLQLSFSSSIFGDIDNDGDLDYVLMGCCDYLYLYENNGTSFIEKQDDVVRGGDALIGIWQGSLAFGDYDNDGYIDFAAIGSENDLNRIYWNNISRKNNFSVDNLASKYLTDDDLYLGTLTWDDVDSDLDLDLIATGLNISLGLLSRVYINNNTIANTKPNPPTINFASSYSDGIFNLSWGNGSDSETNTSGLYYNLMIGNTTQNHTIVSGVFGGSSGGGGGGGPSAGYFGNMMQRKNLSLNKYLNNDTYTWYVQTIDTGLQKSNWSAVQSIVIGGDTTAPVISSVSSSVTSSTATVTWTTGETSNSTVLYGTTISLGSRSSSSSLVASHSISLSSLSASTLYYYNVSSCDNWNNCNTSIRYNFTTSAAGGDGGGGGGGGGSGGGGSSKIITPTPEPEKKLFDIDFSSVSCGIFEAEQGDIKTFTFNGEIIHEIAISEIISPSARLIFRPESLGLLIKTQEIKQIDLNKDNINDLQIKLFSIINKKASFSLCKLAGADILSQEEIEEAIRKEALFDVKIAIVNLFEIVRSGREVIANIEAINVNHIGQVDVIVDYYITSKKDNMTKLAQGSDTLAVEAVTSFVRSLKVPYNTKSGNYLFNVDITYKDFMTSSNAEFRVIRNYEIIIGIGVIVFIVVVIFFYLWILKRKENKLEGQIKIMKKSMGNKILIIRKKKKGDKKWQK